MVVNSGGVNNTLFYDLLSYAAPFSIYHPPTPSSLRRSFIVILLGRLAARHTGPVREELGAQTGDLLLTASQYVLLSLLLRLAFVTISNNIPPLV